MTISDDVAKAAVLDVRKTYRHLAKQAQESGAELFVDTNVTDVITDEQKKPIGVIAKSADKEL